MKTRKEKGEKTSRLCVRSMRHAEQCFADFAFRTPFHPKSLITSLETSHYTRVA